MIIRALLGFVIAVLIAWIARRTRSLSPSGAAAAIGIGTIAAAAGWSWGVLLVVYFALSTLLSQFGREEKERRTASIIARGGERDAAQVLANGAVFAIAAAGSVIHPDPRWIALGVGSLAASAADTWATEIGTLFSRHPRSVLTGRPVPPGTSGGVTAIGLLAALAGASFVGGFTRWYGWGESLTRAIVIGGVAGALVDSLLGATIQSRRWCDGCACETERHVHDCGVPTRPLRGLGWLGNDLVNFVSVAVGGLLAVLLVR